MTYESVNDVMGASFYFLVHAPHVLSDDSDKEELDTREKGDDEN